MEVDHCLHVFQRHQWHIHPMVDTDKTVNEEFSETADLLRDISGGRELLDFLGGEPNFGDAEIISLHLDREGSSTLRLETQGHSPAIVTFLFGHWIDVSMRGFSQQNVVGGLKLKRAGKRNIDPWERGVGLVPGDIEIELDPCFGANGVIRAGY